LRDHPQYEVLRELDRGGMGVVYLAKNRPMDRLEVLKVVHKHLLDQYPGMAERFLREIRSGAQLRHPNIVTAYAALQVGDLLVLAMEYVEGENLARLVKARGRLPVGDACSYARQAALGLQYASERGMVHRDIKPGNLILARDGTKHVVKILDFGLAKATRGQERVEHDLAQATSEQEGAEPNLTRAGQVLGTPGYMAPEQTEDAARADSRADVSSLGCTLYFLLTGRPPFQARSLYGLLQAHQSLEATPLNEVRQEVPAELAAAVAKMLAKDPARRYQTPAEVAQALAPFVEDLKPLPLGSPADSKVEEKRPATEPRPTPGARGTRKWWGLAVVGLALLLLVGAVGLWLATKTADRKPDIVAKVKEVTGIDLVSIPAGEFDMGAGEEDKDAAADEKPRHRVRISKPFYLSKYKVTVGQFRRFVEATGHQTDAEKAPEQETLIHGVFSSRETRARAQETWKNYADIGLQVEYPVTYVSWNDADAFCRWLARETGANVRLPREAEWEYSCRAGTATKFSFGDNEAELGDYAWYKENHKPLPPYYGYPNLGQWGDEWQKWNRELFGGWTRLVGEKKPNAFGLYDMHGLAREWCADGKRTYKNQDETDPEGPTAAGGPRIIRGGGWRSDARDCRAAKREELPPSSWRVPSPMDEIHYRREGFGFRVLVSE
jgi:formylglycine-generating enzyme required for sulfatase activity/tRNA A-37 threonylcarbamoyl transferase component Bud32